MTNIFLYRNKNHSRCIGIINDIKTTEISEDFTHIRTKNDDLITVKTAYISVEVD